jgi:hypothetical protein
MKKIILLILCSILLSGCVVNQKVSYDNLKFNLSEVKAKTVTIGLLDHRQSVIDGSRKPDFVGNMRNNFGVAFPIGTKSKNDFMLDLSNDMVESLKRFDINAVNVTTNWKESEMEVKSKLFTSESSRKIFLVFDTFNTDGMAIQVLHYKINVFIYDKDGTLLKYKLFDGERKLGGNVAFGAGAYKKYMPEAIVKLFGEIFNDKEILNAINNN